MYLKSPYPDLPEIPDVNTFHVLWDQADERKDYTLHIDAITGRKRGYYEFRERVRLAATAVGTPVKDGGLGIEPGEVVGIISQNCLDYITLVHSLLAITAPFALISAYATPFELTHALVLTKPTRLFVESRLLPVLLPVAKQTGFPLDQIYLLSGKAYGRKTFDEMIEETRSKKIPLLPPCPANRDTLAYLIFSSGTSGLPKAVMVSHGNIACALQQSKTIDDFVAKEGYKAPQLNTPEGIPVHLAALPMHHTVGIHKFCFHPCSLLAPVTFVILGRWNLEGALRAIPKYTITFVQLVPSLVHQIVNYPRLAEIDLSSIRGMASGAAYLPPDLAAKLLVAIRNVLAFREGYGMSETTSVAIVQPGGLNKTFKRVEGSVGLLVPGMEARIVRDDGSEAEVNEVGHLLLRGQNLALGYWRNEKATKETFVNSWLHTGDRFCANQEGYFFFVDRAKDTLKVSGVQVSPTEIENVLLGEPRKLITDACVAGVSGGRTRDEQIPRAWVVLSDAGQGLGVETTITELEKWHRANLSRYKWLKGGIEVVEEIPKSQTGKVLRRVLQEGYEKRSAKILSAKL